MQNFDWQSLKSKDIYSLFESFIKALYPDQNPSDRLIGVDIYQSEFGIERLRIENEEGPLRFLQEGMIDDEKGGRKINPIVLRTYELDRLRYYFAVIQFSTKFVAEKIY